MSDYENYEPQEDYEPKKKGGFLGKFVALLLGFILGIVATVGGVAGAGFYIYKKVTIKQAADTITGWMNVKEFNLSAYVTDDYANKTLEQTIGSLSKLFQDAGGVGNTSTLSLDSFSAVTSYTETIVKQVKEFLAKYGIDIDEQEFSETPFVKLSTYIQNILYDIRLSGILNAANVTMDNLMTYLCYGEEGVDYEIVNGEIQMKEGKKERTLRDLTQGDGIMGVLYQIPLDVLLELDLNGATEPDSVMKALAFGTEGVHYEIQNIGGKRCVVMKEMRYTATHDTTAGTHTLFDELGNPISGAIYDAGTGAFAITQSDGSLLYAAHAPSLPDGVYRVYDSIDTTAGALTPLKFKKRTIKDLTGNASGIIATLRIGDIMTIDDTSAPLMQAIKDWTIEDLKKQENLEGLKIGDILDVGDSSSSFMKAIEDWKISDLKDQEKINTLPLEAVIPTTGAPKMLQALMTMPGGTTKTTIGTISERIETLTVNEVLDGADSNKILQKIGDTPVTKLAERLNTLSVQELYTETVFKMDAAGNNYLNDSNAVICSKDNLFYHANSDGTFQFYDVSKAGTGITKDNFNVNASYASGCKVELVLTGTWKYLLSNGTETNRAYMITDMNKLVENMQTNMKTAPIENLNKDLDMGLSADLLNSTLKPSICTTAGITQGKRMNVGQLSIKELTDYVNAILNNSTIQGIPNT